MFKSVFTKYMLGFTLVFVLCFLGFSLVIYGYVSEYATGEEMKNVRSTSYSAKIMLDKMYENYFALSPEREMPYSSFLEEKKSDVDAAIDGIAKFGGIGILVLKGGVVSSGTDGSCVGLKVQEDFDSSLYTGTKKSVIEGLIEKECYISAVRLAGTEDNYVLCFNLTDTTAALSSKLIQAIIVATASVFLLGLVANYAISYRMTMPLREMSRAAKRFADGDFSARVPVRGKDEIADLSEAFNNMAQSLSELEEQRSAFFANVSHDLRTPMTSISGFIDGILDGTIPENRDHYLQVIGVEVKRLSRLVRTLLEVSRIEAGARKFNMTNFDICETAMTILLSFEKQIEEKELVIEYDSSQDQVFVKADTDAIYQVLYNLIDNAVKFSRDKGKLRLTVRETPHGAQIEVYNEGQGISSEDLPHIFDRFYKADKSRGVDKSGYGLGLFISKTILQAHGENIRAESEEGKYCRFVFTLPKGEKPQRKPTTSGEFRKDDAI